MIAKELKNDVSTVRIHDEFYETSPEKSLARSGHIVSESYKRRQSHIQLDKRTPTHATQSRLQ